MTKETEVVDPHARFKGLDKDETKERLLNYAYTVCMWFQATPTDAKGWEELVYLSPYARSIAGIAGLILLHVLEKKQAHEDAQVVVSLYPKYPSFPVSNIPVEVGILDAEIIMKAMLTTFAFNKEVIIVDDESVREYDTFCEVLKQIIMFCKLVTEGGDLLVEEEDDYDFEE
jgi:hypothetical protein